MPGGFGTADTSDIDLSEFDTATVEKLSEALGFDSVDDLKNYAAVYKQFKNGGFGGMGMPGMDFEDDSDAEIIESFLMEDAVNNFSGVRDIAD